MVKLSYLIFAGVLISCLGCSDDEKSEIVPFPSDFEFTNTLNDSLSIYGGVSLWMEDSADTTMTVTYIFKAVDETVMELSFKAVPIDMEDWDKDIFEHGNVKMNKFDFTLRIGRGRGRVMVYGLKDDDQATIWLDGDLEDAKIIVSANLNTPIVGYTTFKLNYNGEYAIQDNRDIGG